MLPGPIDCFAVAGEMLYGIGPGMPAGRVRELQNLCFRHCITPNHLTGYGPPYTVTTIAALPVIGTGDSMDRFFIGRCRDAARGLLEPAGVVRRKTSLRERRRPADPDGGAETGRAKGCSYGQKHSALPKRAEW